MIDIQPHASGCTLPVRVQPGAKRNSIVGEQAGALKVAVTQAPEKGKANQAVVEVLADSLDLRKSQIELLSGATNRNKRFIIANVSPEELHAIILGRLESGN